MKKTRYKLTNKELKLSLDVYKDEKGKEWFKAQDISEFLGYRYTNDMTRNLNLTETHMIQCVMRNKSGARYNCTFMDDCGFLAAVNSVRNTIPERYELAQKISKWIMDEIESLGLRTCVLFNRKFYDKKN